MFDWIYSNREAFLSNYVEIGRNHGAAKKLQEEHNQFTVASNVSIDSGTRIDGERNLEIDSFNLNIGKFSISSYLIKVNLDEDHLVLNSAD